MSHLKSFIKMFICVLAGICLVIGFFIFNKVQDENNTFSGSARNDLAEDLIEVIGDEYQDKIIYTKQIDGKDVHVYESQYFIMENKNYNPINEMKEYKIIVERSRYTKDDNGAVLNETFETREYTGYENTSSKDYNPAKVDFDTLEISYDNETLFNDLDAILKVD